MSSAECRPPPSSGALRPAAAEGPDRSAGSFDTARLSRSPPAGRCGCRRRGRRPPSAPGRSTPGRPGRTSGEVERSPPPGCPESWVQRSEPVAGSIACRTPSFPATWIVPSGPTTGPGVMPPPRSRLQRIAPVVGPSVVDAPLWRASCWADGHGAHVAVPGTCAVDGSGVATRVVPAAAGGAAVPHAASSTPTRTMPGAVRARRRVVITRTTVDRRARRSGRPEVTKRERRDAGRRRLRSGAGSPVPVVRCRRPGPGRSGRTVARVVRPHENGGGGSGRPGSGGYRRAPLPSTGTLPLGPPRGAVFRAGPVIGGNRRPARRDPESLSRGPWRRCPRSW